MEPVAHLEVDGVRVYAALPGGVLACVVRAAVVYQGIELIDPLTVTSPSNVLL